MKKICVVLALLLFCIGCTPETPANNSEDIKTFDSGICVSWVHFGSAEEVVDFSSHIFEGVVIDIDFVVYNELTEEDQLTPVLAEEKSQCCLYTIYEIAVIRTYKGNTNLIEKIRLIGGIEDQLLVEQKEAMEKAGTYDPDKGIQLVQGAKHVQKNATYLFCVWGEDGCDKAAISPYYFALPEKSLYPSLPACSQEEILKHLPYVPHPLLIAGVVVLIVGVVGVTTVLLIRRKKKKNEEPEQIPEVTI